MRTEAVAVVKLDVGTVPASADTAARAIGRIGQAGEISARQTAAAMRMLPAQFTDVATQLAGGQNPLLILLQQGGQVKDSFGGIRNALGGIAAAISPAALGIGAIAAAVGVLVAGARDADRLRDVLALTGNAAGLTAARMDDLSRSVAAGSRQTVGGARDIALALAESGAVSGRVLDSMAMAVARVADVSGRDAKEVAKDFATMSAGVADWAHQHNKAWNFISAEQYAYISRLEQQGDAEQAMIVTNQLVTEHLAQQGTQLGLLERAWDGVRDAASGAWRSMLDIGRDRGAAGRRQDAGHALGRAQRAAGSPLLEWFTGSVRQAEEAIRAANTDLLRETETASARAEAAAQNRRRIDAERDAERERKAEAARAATSARSAAARAQREAERIAERAFDRTPGAVDDSILDPLDARVEAVRRNLANDPLGAFADDQLNAQAKRDEARLRKTDDYLGDLLEANARANAALIEGDRDRGLAQIEIDRQAAMRRLEQMGLDGAARIEAERLIGERAAIAGGALQGAIAAAGERGAREAALATRQQVGSALAAALLNSRNPARAFADALGNIVFQRLTSRIADAMATAAVGVDGTGGLLGGLLSFVGGIAGGGLALDTGVGITSGGMGLRDHGIGGGMASGTNYVPRDMFVKVHRGEAITPAKYNHAGAGAVNNITIQTLPGTRAETREQRNNSGGTDTMIRLLRDGVRDDLIDDMGRGGRFAGAMDASMGTRRSAGLMK